MASLAFVSDVEHAGIIGMATRRDIWGAGRIVTVGESKKRLFAVHLECARRCTWR